MDVKETDKREEVIKIISAYASHVGYTRAPKLVLEQMDRNEKIS